MVSDSEKRLVFLLSLFTKHGKQDPDSAVELCKCKRCGAWSSPFVQPIGEHGALHNHALFCCGMDYENDHSTAKLSTRNFKKMVGDFVTKRFFKRKPLEEENFRWLENVVLGNTQLSRLEDCIRKSSPDFVKHIDQKSMRDLMLKTTSLVDRQLGILLENSGLVSIIFCSFKDENKGIAMFAGFNDEHCGTHKEVLLCVMSRKEAQNVPRAMRSFVECIARFRLREVQLLCVVAAQDKGQVLAHLSLQLSTNSNFFCRCGCKSIAEECAKLWNVPFIPCFLHRFDTAVDHWLQEGTGCIQALTKCQNIMMDASTKTADALHQPLDETWKSKMHLVQRHFAAKEEMSKFHCNLDRQSIKKLEALNRHFDAFETIEQSLGAAESTAAADAILKTFIRNDTDSQHESVEVSLKSTECTSPFLTAIYKISKGTRLNHYEEEAAAKLKCPRHSKMRKVSQGYGAPKEYEDAHIVPATCSSSNSVFSDVAQDGISPIVFQSILFLKGNHFLWNPSTVADAMKVAVPPSSHADGDFHCEGLKKRRM